MFSAKTEADSIAPKKKNEDNAVKARGGCAKLGTVVRLRGSAST